MLFMKKGVVIGEVCGVSSVIPLITDENEKQNYDNDSVPAVNKNENSLPADVDFLSAVDLSHLSNEERTLVADLLREESDVFSKSESDIGDIKSFEMKIKLSDDIPVREAYRHLPRNLYNEVRNYVHDMLLNGWIRESYSSYASPIVCVRKKDGGLRMCIDYRKLNMKTIPDSQPIPKIQEILDNLHGNSWFSTLDMSKAYHQGYVHEDSRKYTAFCTPWALYEWLRIPFGLKNAPPGFQRFINNCLDDLVHNICEPYLDDILCFGRTFNEHLHNLRRILQRLKARGVKLRADKCKFFHKEVRYLGRLISGDGYRPDPKDTEVLEKFRTPPQNIGEVRSLLGFFGYYRSFVQNFSTIMKPLYDLLKVKPQNSKSKSNTKSNSKTSYNAKQAIQWNSNLQSIVDKMIDLLKSPKIISFPDFNNPFFVTCDASSEGLGAVLYQKQDGKSRVISFASRSLTNAERNYHSSRLEFLALKWAICDKFSDYLKYGPGFTVYTDNNPLTYVLSTAKLNAVGLRWVSELADYNFTIKYRPGRVNVDADYLSRNAQDIDLFTKQCTESCSKDNIDSIVNAAVSVDVVTDISVDCLSLPGKETLKIDQDELKKAQQDDDVVGVVYKAVLENQYPSRKKVRLWNKGSRLMLHHFKKLKIQNGILVRSTSSFSQIVLPKMYHELVFKHLHDNLGHLGLVQKR